MSLNHTNSNRSPTDDLKLNSLSLESNQNESPRAEIQSPAGLRSPRASTSYTSTINADIQAKLLAFQEQRQSKPGSSLSSPSSEQVNEALREDNIPNDQTNELEKQSPTSTHELLPNISLHRQNSLKKNKPLPPLPPADKAISLPPSLSKINNNRLNPIRPAPSLPVNSQVSPQVTARFPKQKQSLSQRRGMKLPNGLPSLSTSGASSTVKTSAPLSGSLQDGPQELPSRSPVVSSLADNRGKISALKSNQLKGLFANYSDYVDIKSGSLNFQDKLSLDSNGVNFKSGQKFSISAKDLELIEEIGRGNYGTVTKVLHRPSNVIMAMKEVRLELDDSKFRQILMELQVLHNCDSPYIVDFFGAFFVEGAVYMCIEYMDAGSLDKIYSNGVDEAHLAYITKSVIEGLKELKDVHNIIHRDVKPTNILVNSQGKVKLCDFGVSGNLVASLAKTNIGCQSYMAPERIKSLNPDDSTYSVQSDIWSLGLTILETAKGSYPYPPETYDNIFSQLSAIVEGSPPELPNTYSAEARDFVQRCLDKNPDRRPNYSQLLEHPWLKKYRNDKVDMGKYIQCRLQEADLLKDEENAKNFEELNRKLKTPALHRGGAPTS